MLKYTGDPRKRVIIWLTGVTVYFSMSKGNNMKVLIGSRALSFWFNDMKIKETSDWDVISEEYIEGTEWHKPEFLGSDLLLEFAVDSPTVDFNGHQLKVMNPWGLSIIKRSHLWRDLKFQKHITHYHKWLKDYSRKHYSARHEELLKIRTDLTMQEFKQSNPNLMQKKEDFFNDAVVKKYDHDYLHELVAFYQQPLYKKLQKDSTLAWCIKDLWYDLDHQDKLRCVAEEVYVISIERFLVRNNWDFPYRLAYIKALDKVCTTLCSGWFRDFAIDNYPEVEGLFDKAKIESVKFILEKEN